MHRKKYSKNKFLKIKIILYGKIQMVKYIWYIIWNISMELEEHNHISKINKLLETFLK